MASLTTSFSLLFLLLLVDATIASLPHLDIHVCYTGLCGASATPSFRTLHDARDHLRSMRSVTPGKWLTLISVHVLIHTGTYAPLELDSRDSSHVHVTYMSLPGEVALVSGGVTVPRASFLPVPGKPFLYVADIRALALTENFGSLGSGGNCIQECTNTKMELYFNTERMVLARYPNLKANTSQYQFLFASASGQGVINYNPKSDPDAAAHLLSWKDEVNPFILGYMQWDWADCTRTLNGIKNSSDAIVLLLSGSDTVEQNARFVGLNLYTELDSPNEYYIDELNQLLYLYMASPPATWNMDPILSVSMVAMNISNIANHSFNGLTIAYARMLGVSGDNVVNVNIENCVIFGIGQDGVLLNGFNSGVRNSKIYSTGCAGVSLVSFWPLFSTRFTLHSCVRFLRASQGLKSG